MHIALDPPTADLPDAALPRELGLLLARARQLQEPRNAASLATRLKGKNLALLSDSARGHAALLFTSAARGLGAHVAHIRPALGSFGGFDSDHAIDETARMLGRLYDAIECQGMPASIVSRIGEAAGVPVFDGVATEQHASAALLGRLRQTTSRLARRRLLVQACLVNSIN